jgi:hypothetical protein
MLTLSWQQNWDLLELDHRIKTHRRTTQPEKRNHCHAMICNDLSSKCGCHDPSQCAYERHSPPPPGHPLFWILSGGVNASHKRTGRTMASAIWRWITVIPWHQQFEDELLLCQNYRKNQEVNLLFVSILWLDVYMIVSLFPSKDGDLNQDKIIFRSRVNLLRF